MSDTVTALALIALLFVALAVFIRRDMSLSRREEEQLRRDIEDLRRQYKEDRQ